MFDDQSTKKFATIFSRWLRTSTLYRPPARFYKLARVVRAIGPGRERIIWPIDSLILSYQLGVPYYSKRCPKKETFLVKAPLFAALSNFASS